MSIVSRTSFGFALATCLVACGDQSPGALAGTWQMSDGLTDQPIVVTFRPGETEIQGVIEKVTYRTEGRDVLLAYTEGLAKGASLRYTVVDPNTATSPLGVLHRVR